MKLLKVRGVTPPLPHAFPGTVLYRGDRLGFRVKIVLVLNNCRQSEKALYCIECVGTERIAACPQFSRRCGSRNNFCPCCFL
jgi:hypothetical protein